jgi:uncharacterized membrane protein HdeD (DUF308 family)
MYSLKNTNVLGVIYLVFGILCIILKSRIVTLAAICAGAALVGFGIYFIVRELVYQGILMIVGGVLTGILGFLVVSIILYILAIALIVIGIQRLAFFFRTRAVNDTILRPDGIRPILLITCGVVLVFNQVGVLNIMFVFIGVLLMINGVLALLDRN